MVPCKAVRPDRKENPARTSLSLLTFIFFFFFQWKFKSIKINDNNNNFFFSLPVIQKKPGINQYEKYW